MSDSELSDAPRDPVPPDHELERSLRQSLNKASRAGADYSYNSVRAASETELGLPAGFYKTHPEWKDRSKQVINDQMSKNEAPPSSPPKPKSKPTPKSPPQKRASVEKDRAPRKKQKTSRPGNQSKELSPPLSDADSKAKAPSPPPPKKQSKPSTQQRRTPAAKQSKVAEPDSAEEDDDDEDEVKAATTASHVAEDSESELSELLDDAPPKKKQAKASKQSESKSKQRKPAASKNDTEDPDQAEIKRLQGWLVKCGIRKLWGKELKPYATASAKIKHLRGMLADVGMAGRYSNEKAAQIKEARELAADIEAVQEGNERWGADEGAGGDGKPADQPRRRLVRGAQNYAFLSSDGEETD